MSTPACIAIQYPDGIACIYLSSSGYPQWAGTILLHHWNTQEKAEQLLQGGNLYHLDIELGEEHDSFQAQIRFANEEKKGNEGWCQFKLRDYDRRLPPPTDEAAQTFRYLETILVLNNEQETPWTYLFTKGRWLIYSEKLHGIELTEENVNILTERI